MDILTIPSPLPSATHTNGVQSEVVNFWELVDPVVADPVRQDNDKKNNIQMYTEIPY